MGALATGNKCHLLGQVLSEVKERMHLSGVINCEFKS